jgi:DNA-binding GntR family transcriptional regulator
MAAVLSRIGYRCNMSTTATAYAFAKQAILDGRFPGGELISEGEVARELGLSRTPVREAFLLLEAEGLLRLYPKRGALVVPVSPAEVASVMETRVLVESFAVERAARSCTPELTAALSGALADQERLVAEGDVAAFVEADREFHRLFVEAAGNPILLQVHDSLRDRQARMGLAALARSDDRLRQIVDEHRAIAAAVGDGRAEEAAAQLTAHLGETLRLLRENPT